MDSLVLSGYYSYTCSIGNKGVWITIRFLLEIRENVMIRKKKFHMNNSVGDELKFKYRFDLNIRSIQKIMIHK